MATIPVEARISTEQLLHALEQLPPQELTPFLERLLALHAQRQGSHLSESETALLAQINRGIGPQLTRRLEELVAKRQDETINADELYELVDLTEQVEQRDVERLVALDALARLRGVLLADLLVSLGIPSADDA